MIQVGIQAMFGVTYGATGLPVAARIFNTSGPVGGWQGMSNYDGFSYNIPLTFSIPGAYSIKYVVFTDGSFTARDSSYSEAKNDIQVVDISALVGGGNTNPISIQISDNETEIQISDNLVENQVSSNQIEI